MGGNSGNKRMKKHNGKWLLRMAALGEDAPRRSCWDPQFCGQIGQGRDRQVTETRAAATHRQTRITFIYAARVSQDVTSPVTPFSTAGKNSAGSLTQICFFSPSISIQKSWETKGRAASKATLWVYIAPSHGSGGCPSC